MYEYNPVEMFEALEYDEKEILRVAREFHRTVISAYLESNEFSLLLTIRHVIPMLREQLQVWKISVTFQVRESEDEALLPRSITYFSSSRSRGDQEI